MSQHNLCLSHQHHPHQKDFPGYISNNNDNQQNNNPGAIEQSCSGERRFQNDVFFFVNLNYFFNCQQVSNAI